MEINQSVLDKYNEFCASIETPYTDELKERVAAAAPLVHMLMLGIPGEVGEILDLVKRKIIYGKDDPDYDAKLLEEYGDLFFFFIRAISHSGFTLDQVMQANFDKLSIRYKEGKFEQNSALFRDLSAELKALKRHT